MDKKSNDNGNQKNDNRSNETNNQDTNKQNQNSQDKSTGMNHQSSEENEKVYQKKEIKATSGETANDSRSGQKRKEDSHNQDSKTRPSDSTNQILNEEEEDVETADAGTNGNRERDSKGHNVTAAHSGNQVQNQSSNKGK